MLLGTKIKFSVYLKICTFLKEFTKYLRPILVFMGNGALREKFNFKRFLLVYTKVLFW